MEETPQTGYRTQTYNGPVKRYCQTLDLKDDPALIAEYRKRHSPGTCLEGNPCWHPRSRYPRNGNLYSRHTALHDC